MSDPIRPRRNRKTESIRSMVQETHLRPNHLVWPVFILDGENQKSEIPSMPGVFRYSVDLLIEEAKRALELKIPAMALFPVIPEDKKDPVATESLNPKGLLPVAIQKIKKAVPEMTLITDVAMDPYSSDGHDGLVKNGKILNDETLEILSGMAVNQAKAGADIIAPSDMMDGRIRAIRTALDQAGYSETGILSYAAKFASAFYGPFRDALGSAPKNGDKKTYQMDPANRREALREVSLDINEGADIVMVKPAGPYLDVIQDVRRHAQIPVAAYQVSGEYAMIKFAAQHKAVDEDKAMMESLMGIKRAGADIIFTYFALRAAAKLQSA